MTILVTGSEGFIGRNLVGNLKYRGKDVLEFDVKLHPQSVLFEGVDFDRVKMIYHLGAISSTLETDLERLLDLNVHFSVRLFEKAIKHKVPVLFTSSASIYGNTMKEGERMINPLNMYATTKVMVEMWMRQHWRDFERVGVYRLFNVYGKNEKKEDRATSPVWKFTQQALNEGVIKVFKGSEKMIRDFVAVDDVLKEFVDMSDGSVYGTYDFGTAEPISFLKVAQLVSEKYDVPIKFIDIPKNMNMAAYQYYTKAQKTFDKKMLSVAEWLSKN